MRHTHSHTHSRTRKESGKCNADDGFKIPRGKRRGAQHILTTSGAAGLQQGATKCGKGTATATATGTRRTGQGREGRGVRRHHENINTIFDPFKLLFCPNFSCVRSSFIFCFLLPLSFLPALHSLSPSLAVSFSFVFSAVLMQPLPQEQARDPRRNFCGNLVKLPHSLFPPSLSLSLSPCACA